MQYGGWYNGRQWDGTRLGAPGEIIVGNNSSGNAATNSYDYYDQAARGQVDQYINELNQMAQGDYDFTAKWIEENYKLAVGKNDQETANFLKTVASKLEEDRGRLVYDYETGKYRAEQVAQMATERTTGARDRALARLAEDEKLATSNFDMQKRQEIAATNSNLNQRGLISAPRDQQTGLAGQVIGEQNQDLSNRWSAIQNEFNRSKQDTTIGAQQDLQDIAFNKANTMEQLDTTARRGIIDEQNQRTYETEAAKRKLEAAQRENEIARQQGYLSASQVARNKALQSSTGQYYG